MPLVRTVGSDSFRSAQQVHCALILLRMSLKCSYAGGLCAGEPVLIEQPAVDLGRRLDISMHELMLKVEAP
jgi:hypothetical protein